MVAVQCRLRKPARGVPDNDAMVSASRREPAPVGRPCQCDDPTGGVDRVRPRGLVGDRADPGPGGRMPESGRVVLSVPLQRLVVPEILVVVEVDVDGVVHTGEGLIHDEDASEREVLVRQIAEEVGPALAGARDDVLDRPGEQNVRPPRHGVVRTGVCVLPIPASDDGHR